MDNWLALYISLVWYCEITPEQALNQVFGKTKLNYNTKNKNIDITKIEKCIKRKNFRNIHKLEKRYKLSRYEILGLISEEGRKFLSEKINNQEKQDIKYQ